MTLYGHPHVIRNVVKCFPSQFYVPSWKESIKIDVFVTGVKLFISIYLFVLCKLFKDVFSSFA